MRRSAACLPLVLLLACGGRKVEDLQQLDSPRPPYGSLNLDLRDQTNGTVRRQLFLDLGNQAFPRQYPLEVANHQDLQSVKLWRYDFMEAGAVAPAETWYATLLVRVDDRVAAQNLDFWGRGGSFPAQAFNLNPSTLFAEQDVPDAPANHKEAALFLFIRQGNRVRLADPETLGRTGPYRELSEKATVITVVPGMDFPVGGATLETADGKQSLVGNPGPVTDVNAPQQDGKPSDSIAKPGTTVDGERVLTASRVSPVTSEWDLLFAWQPPALGVTFTHGAFADPTKVPDPYANGTAAFQGGGFFATTLPGIRSPEQGRNFLSWTYLMSASDSIWMLGWSAEVASTGAILAGQNGSRLDTKLPGTGTVNAQIRGYLAGLMHPEARATQFQGRQDKHFLGGGSTLLYKGNRLPLVARSTRSAIKEGKLSQLVVAGRTLWYRQNDTVPGADVPNGDQSLVDRYGTTLDFSAYLPIKEKQ